MTATIKKKGKKSSPKGTSQSNTNPHFDPEKITALPSMEDALQKYKKVTGICKQCSAIPDIGIEEFRDLCVSIAATGLQHPVLVTEDGQLVDGRCRVRACHVTGAKLRWRTIPNEQCRFKIAMANFTGRKLQAGQKAAFACRLLPTLMEWAKQRQKKRAGKAVVSDANNPAAYEIEGLVDFQTLRHLRLQSGSARDQAAALVGCSGKSVSDFQLVQKHRPLCAAEVEAGTAKLGSKMKLLKVESNPSDTPPSESSTNTASTADEDDVSSVDEDVPEEPAAQQPPAPSTNDISPTPPKPSTTKPKESRETFFAEMRVTFQKYVHANAIVLELPWLKAPLVLLRRADACVLTEAIPNPADDERFDEELEEAVLSVIEKQLRTPRKNLLNKHKERIRTDFLQRLEQLPAKRGVTAPTPKKTKERAPKKASKPKRKSQ